VLLVQGSGTFAIAHSTLQSLYLNGNANASITNCYNFNAIPISVQRYYGTLSLNQTRFNATLSVYDSTFYLRGPATFAPNAALILTAPNKTISNTYPLENFNLTTKPILVNNTGLFWSPINQTIVWPPHSAYYLAQIPPVYVEPGLQIPSLPPPTFEFELANRTFIISKGENITVPVTVIGHSYGSLSLLVTFGNDTSKTFSIPGINVTLSNSKVPVSGSTPTSFNMTISIGQEAQSGFYEFILFGKENWDEGWVGEVMPVGIIIL
jgi:hypothetical protein